MSTGLTGTVFKQNLRQFLGEERFHFSMRNLNSTSIAGIRPLKSTACAHPDLTSPVVGPPATTYLTATFKNLPSWIGDTDCTTHPALH